MEKVNPYTKSVKKFRTGEAFKVLPRETRQVLIFLGGLILILVLAAGIISWNYRRTDKELGNESEKQNLIRIQKPRPNEIIKSPLKIEGEARGYWFFEASFPVKLLDASGKELGRNVARALSDWMTENFVAFETEIEFQKPETNRGVLILEKDNPSGLPENADELRIPVRF